MTCLRKYFIFLFMVLFSSICAFSQTTSRWKTVTHLGQQYIPARSIVSQYKSYNFQTTAKAGNILQLKSAPKRVNIDFRVGSQEIFMNGIKFHFSYPVVYKDRQYLVSRIDFVKLIDPILRPAQINRTAPFRTVIIDPGHGGKDPGTSSRYGKEKRYTLSLAKKLKSRLEKKGFRVALTRYTDQYLSLSERVAIANRFNNAIFISLHFNSGGAGRADGIETFSLSPQGVSHYGRNLKASDFKKRAGNAQDTANIALATALHGRVIRTTKRRDRGIRRARYSVLTGVRHPAILFEGGFMSHAGEAQLINRDGYLELMAQAMFEGIVLYKTATEKKLVR